MSKALQENDYPLCDRCIYHEGCHSTIFGQSWTCGKKYEKASEVYDNDWEVKEHGAIPTPCPHYIKGKPLINVVLG